MEGKTQANTQGKVYLVGAGPSDPELLTLKGLRVLQQAQVVIYDALIGHGIYSMIPQGAEKIAAGKRAGSHTMKQEDINRLILEQAQKGRRVVRLKGGDPFLFGRGGEELELLIRHQIPYEIVPGVTSAVAAAAYAGIPVTYRGISSGVHILTGHKKQDEPLDIDFESLVRAGGTTVVLMGMSALHEIAAGFLQAGMPPQTPAAVIEQGTGARQKSVVASLASIVEEAGRHSLRAPAVIVIGAVAACGKRYAWWEKLPLSGCRILVTRPAARSGALAGLLREQGAEVLEIPAIRTQAKDVGAQLLKVLAEIGTYRYLAFTSPAGVEHFFELLDRLEMDVRCIGQVKLAAIGSATGDALRKHGLRPQLMPERYNGAALGRLLQASMQDGEKVLLLRSSMGSRELVEQIQAKKQIEVTDLAIYDTITAENTIDAENMTDAENTADTANTMETNAYLRALLEEGEIDLVMFTSASTVRGFAAMAQGADYTKVNAVCIGEMTAKQACFYGMQAYLSEKETIESMVQAAVRCAFRRRKQDPPNT
ncbi:MAG: uroporphyrinogen-III C-methyltransferase [Eubacterium sp.]|nr:uroporphyrinogen-III C-methyltransferase [Eubacterium sp.]